MKFMKPSFGLAPVWAALLVIGAGAASVQAADIEVTMHKLTAEGTGAEIGTITFRDSSEHGLLIIPNLRDLSPGIHGFHVHEHAGCAPMTKDGKPVSGAAAGGHFDPEKTGRHEGPVGKGHLGDLPVLVADADGNAAMAMFSPRLQVPDLVGHALIIHAGGDNYSDKPAPLGGGGARVACGVVEVGSI